MHFYLSYAFADKALASEIISFLLEDDYQVSSTPHEQDISDLEWIHSIDQSDLLLLLITPDALQDSNFESEWRYALSRQYQIWLMVEQDSATDYKVPQGLVGQPTLFFESLLSLSAQINETGKAPRD